MRNYLKTTKPLVLLIGIITILSYRAPDNDNTPIGTVIHSLMPPSYFFENHKGWILMKGQKFSPGSSLNQSDLYQSLLSHPIGNMDSLPDARGMFVRGANFDGGADVDSTRILGHPQLESTRLPNSEFIGTGLAKNDSLSVNNYEFLLVAGKGNLEGKGSAMGGSKIRAQYQKNYIKSDHLHNVEIVVNGGGDKETRPKNISLYTYIKIN